MNDDTNDDTNDDRMAPRPFICGDWTVLPSRNLITRGDQHRRVEPRVMDVLVVLAEHAGQVVTKDQLIERVWRAQHVGDEVVSVTIYALRKALGDNARQPRYIETVPRRGYRWVASVDPALPEPADVPTRAPSHHDHATPAARRLRWTTTNSLAAVSLTVVALAALVVTTMQRGPSGLRSGRHVASAESHEAYLEGRHFLDQRSIRGWRQALEQFERAIALDPRNPAAHAGLADAYSAMSDFGVASPAELRPRAMKAARRALELDAQSPEGHAALGRAQFLFDWDFAAAERNLARAVELGPEYMPAYQSLAWLESARGRYVEAIAAAKTALQLDPRSMEAHMTKGWVREIAGRPDDAFTAYQAGLRIAGVPNDSLARIGALYRAEGLAGVHRRWLHQRSTGMPLSNTFRAQLYARLGELDRAVESLEQAYRTREGALAWVNVEPSFRPLRQDARFRQIAARVGIGFIESSAPQPAFR